MKIDIHPQIGEILRQWLSESIKSCQPRLCAEFEGAIDTSLFETLLKAICAWSSSFLLVFVSFDDKDYVQLADKSSVKELLNSYFLRGITVTIVDPANASGCTVDWEGFESDNIDSEILVVAWGEHEPIAQTIVDNYCSGTVFRGN